MKLLVCGGRDYNDEYTVKIVLDKIHKETPISLLIAGAAPGADTLAEQWADANHITKRIFPADWTKFLLKAGRIRNKQMLKEGKPDKVLAFPGGPGTRNMIRISTLKGVPVLFSEDYG